MTQTRPSTVHAAAPCTGEKVWVWGGLRLWVQGCALLSSLLSGFSVKSVWLSLYIKGSPVLSKEKMKAACEKRWPPWWSWIPYATPGFLAATILLFVNYINSIPIAVLNTMIKSNLGKKVFVWLTLPGASRSLRKVRTKTQARVERGIMKEHCLLDSPRLMFSYFFYTAQVCLSRDEPALGWALLNKLAVKKPYKHGNTPIW